MLRFLGAQIGAALLAVIVVVPRFGHATIIDVGDVVVTPENTLVVGVTQYGSHTIDGSHDGPYGAIVVAKESGSSGLLALHDSATLETTGSLILRNPVVTMNQPLSLVVEGGSILTSNGATLAEGFGQRPIATISGSGSRWINLGVLQINPERAALAGSDLTILDGGSVLTQGFLADSMNVGTHVTIDGNTSSLVNEGMSIIGPGIHGVLVEIRNGGLLEDQGAMIGSTYGASSLVVQGPGSEWTTGPVALGRGTEGGHTVMAIQGGHISSGSVYLYTQTTASGLVDGVDSLWEIDGELTLPGHAAGAGNAFSVLGGGTLRSKTGSIANTTSVSTVTIGGDGSQWIMSGDLDMCGGVAKNELLISLGGSVQNQNARLRGVYPFSALSSCKVTLDGVLTQWSSRGSVYVSGTEAGPLGGTITTIDLSNGAVASIDETLQIWNFGEVDIDSAQLTAGLIHVSGGVLGGHGTINSAILNEGSLNLDGELKVQGIYSQPTAGSLILHILPERHGLMKVTGPVLLTGSLTVGLDPDFAPPMGAMLPLVTWSNRSGAFSNITVTGGNGSSYLRPIYAQTKLMALVASCDTPGDTDCDGTPDSADKCPFIAGDDQGADTDGDGRGNACECTDQNGDGRNTVSDLVAINAAIFNPSLATPLCDGNNDGLCNVSDIIAGNVEIFSPGNTSTCARQPVPGP